MDITTLLNSSQYGQSLNLNSLNNGSVSGFGQTPLTDYSGLYGGNGGLSTGSGAINYGSGLDLGGVSYDASNDLGTQYMQKAMGGNATMDDFTAMFESFQQRMLELMVKALKAAGLSDENILQLLDTMTGGQGQKALEALQLEGFSGQNGAVPSNGGQLPVNGQAQQTPGGEGPPATVPGQAVTTPESTSPAVTSNTPVSGESVSGEGGLHLPAALEPYRGDILNAAEKSGMPAEVIAGMIWAESRGNLEAVTTNGGNGLSDSGLMQINSNTFAELKANHPAELGNANVNDAGDNILAGALYLREQYDAFGGDMGAALRAYNSGPGNVNVNDLSDISRTGTGNPNYVDYVTSYADTIATGEGQLPA